MSRLPQNASDRSLVQKLPHVRTDVRFPVAISSTEAKKKR